MKPKPTFLFIALLAVVFPFLSGTQRLVSDDLFKSRAFTPANSFTAGAEGPAVDKAGTLYAVNFAREGTIGQITPAGQASLFVELPAGSVGNGIRFNSRGDMFIADYPKHNILKVAKGMKQVSVFATESRMNQPNDIAIDSPRPALCQ